MNVEKSTVSTDSRKVSARLIGALFLAGFVVYGGGSGLVTSVVGAPGFLSRVPSHQSTLVLGAFLMLLVTVVDVGKGILFYPILEKYGKKTALAYLAALIVEVVLMAVGALFLLMVVPIAQAGIAAGHGGASWANALGSLAVESNTMAYQMAQMMLAIGAVFMSALLFRARLIPRLLAGLGVFGYLSHAAGAIAEIFGLHISLILLIPGGLFEVALGFWLIIKGFQPVAFAAYAGRAEVVTTRNRPAAAATL